MVFLNLGTGTTILAWIGWVCRHRDMLFRMCGRGAPPRPSPHQTPSEPHSARIIPSYPARCALRAARAARAARAEAVTADPGQRIPPSSPLPDAI